MPQRRTYTVITSITIDRETVKPQPEKTGDPIDRLFVRYLERIEGTETGRREVTIGVPPRGE